MPDDKIAFGVNQVCGSGLRAVALAAQQIRTGESDIVVAGGQESMSLSQHAAYLRSGVKMGDLQLVDTMIRDGLWDVFNGYHMGVTAENVAKAYQITREDQDALALASPGKTQFVEVLLKLATERGQLGLVDAINIHGYPPNPDDISAR